MVCVVSYRRLPPQGGLPPTDWVGGDVVEIACDESGFSGTNLLDAATPVFTHASVADAEIVSRWTGGNNKGSRVSAPPILRDEIVSYTLRKIC